MDNNKNKKVQAIPFEHDQVYEIIKHAPDKYITRKLILAKLQKEINRSNDRWLKTIISELVTVYEYPVGTSKVKGREGYFKIQTRPDWLLAKRTLGSLSSGIKRREDALDRIGDRLGLIGE